MDKEALLVAEIRLHLEEPNAPLDDVLTGALALSALGYASLATEYAQRVARHARGAGRDDLFETARAFLLGGARQRADA